MRLRALRRVARVEIGLARALRRLGQELQQHSAGAPAWRSAVAAGGEFLADRKPDAGRDLLGADEVFVRGMLSPLPSSATRPW